MRYNVDEMTAAEPPRRRLLVSILAVLVPVAVLAGASAWFIRNYVVPPTVSIEPLAVSSADAVPETTGNSPPAASDGPAPTVRYSTDSAEVWASVPLPGPPRQIQRFAPEPAEPTASPSEPLNGPIPLPPRRPRISNIDIDGEVPLPRPRPLASN